MLLILVLWSQRQADPCEFEANEFQAGYIVRTCLKRERERKERKKKIE